jgi:hypothetical protein
MYTFVVDMLADDPVIAPSNGGPFVSNNLGNVIVFVSVSIVYGSISVVFFCTSATIANIIANILVIVITACILFILRIFLLIFFSFPFLLTCDILFPSTFIFGLTYTGFFQPRHLHRPLA